MSHCRVCGCWRFWLAVWLVAACFKFALFSGPWLRSQKTTSAMYSKDGTKKRFYFWYQWDLASIFHFLKEFPIVCCEIGLKNICFFDWRHLPTWLLARPQPERSCAHKAPCGCPAKSVARKVTGKPSGSKLKRFVKRRQHILNTSWSWSFDLYIVNKNVVKFKSLYFDISQCFCLCDLSQLFSGGWPIES